MQQCKYILFRLASKIKQQTCMNLPTPTPQRSSLESFQTIQEELHVRSMLPKTMFPCNALGLIPSSNLIKQPQKLREGVHRGSNFDTVADQPWYVLQYQQSKRCYRTWSRRATPWPWYTYHLRDSKVSICNETSACSWLGSHRYSSRVTVRFQISEAMMTLVLDAHLARAR